MQYTTFYITFNILHSIYYIQSTTFNILHSLFFIQYTIISIICLNDSYWLTDSLSYPNSRDAIASKKVSKVCRIFLESISYDKSKMVCLKILALGIFELTLLNGPKNIKNWISGVKTSKNIFWTHHNFSREK